MSSTQCIEVASLGFFQNRVRYFLSKAAVSIVAESEATSNHVERLAYASAVLKDRVNRLAYCIAVTTNSTLAADIATAYATTPTAEYANGEITDNDLEFTVNSLIDTHALTL